MRTQKPESDSPNCYVTKNSKEHDTQSEYGMKSNASTNASSKKTKSSTGLSDESNLDPTDVMIKRWIKLIQKRVPTVDLIDISAEAVPNKAKKR